jgi:cytochrome c
MEAAKSEATMKTTVPHRVRHAAAALLCAFSAICPMRAAEPYDPGRFEKEILVPASRDAIQMDVLADGDIVFGEFWGAVKRWDAKSGTVTTLGQVPTFAKGEVGLLGMAAARDFEKSGYVYALFCPAAEQGTMRVSRFTVKDGRMPAESERILLSWPYDTEHVFHMGGAMFMDGKGDLYIGNGDNCHWNPGLPVDTRPDRKNWDAFRSAANSRDLRGKILRIHPTPDGGYSIPAGNLFAEGKDGRAEIYAMGIRNPFRMTVDDATGTLYFGDVGPNVLPELGVVPDGYDEINATKTAGNFGWPLFVGPNEALPLFDFEAKKEIKRLDPQSPENLSPRNTGIKKLPPAKPALVWYSSVASKEFPTLGSGGRSIMAGPVYHFDAANRSPNKLPEALDGRLFIYEWMRNWIQTVKLGTPGPEIEPFVPMMTMRRPIDMKLGRDGALYLIEYGDKWWENADSRIARIVYRRGNRVPVARIVASETAGRQPLTLRFDASGSTDPDGDALTFTWSVAGREQSGGGAKFQHTFEQPGAFEVTVTARDASGATGSAKEIAFVGNARPVVRFETPAHGSFFDWGSEIPYRVSVTETDGDTVQPELVALTGEFRSRRFPGEGEKEVINPGLALMRASTCFACHMADTPSAGPPYKTVALKYKEDPAAAARLAEKILTGGTGVWGQLPMPPHPQHTLAQTRQMVAWVLALKDDPAGLPQSGATGRYTAPKKPGGVFANEGVIILSASYTDDGKAGTLPRLRGEDTVVLHSRRKKAALFDINRGMTYVEQIDGEKGLVGHFKDGANIIFRELNLDGIHRLTARAGCFDAKGGRFELRKDSPSGVLLASVDVKPTGEGEFLDLPAEIANGSGLTDICVIARCIDRTTVLGLNWIEFRP